MTDALPTPIAPGHCPHCGQPITQRYCSACGEQNARSLKLAELLPGVLDQLWEFDYPLARTLKLLASRPATLVQRYWAGDRKHYTHPFKLCFWAATLDFALVLSLGLADKVVVGGDDPNLPVQWLLSLGQYLMFLYLIPVAWLLAFMLRPAVTPLAGYVALLYGFAGVHLLKALTIAVVYLQADVGFWLHRLLTPFYLGWLLFGLLPGAVWSRLARTVVLFFSYVACQIGVNSLLIAVLAVLQIAPG